MGDPGGLASRLGHRFAEPALLEQALTHRSAGAPHNERLEFLGDALLGMVIAAELYARYPHAGEGELTRMRASLVRRETLAQVARELDLGGQLRLGGGELKSGGFRRDSVLANAVEALLGAIYLDGGYLAGREVLRRLFAARLDELPAAALAKDPKSRLQEFLQGRGRPLPEYRVVATEGADHRRRYTVECQVEGLPGTCVGTGSSRRRAEQEAASLALAALPADG
ncbi:MAG TPA: ribonuclease III [Gammaproteobacteria bacterium]